MFELVSSKITIFVNLAIFFLGFITYRKNKKSITNISFFLFTILFSLWLFSNHFQTVISNRFYAELFFKLDFFLAPFFTYCFLIFLFNFPDEINFEKFKNKKNLILIFSIPSIISSILGISGLIIKNLDIEEDKIRYQFTALFIFYSLVILINVFLGLYFQFKRLYCLSGVKRNQIKYFMIGFFLTSCIMLVFNFLLQNKISSEFFRIGNNSAIIMVIFTSYSIIVHKAFDIKLVLRKSFVFLLSVLTVAGFAMTIHSIISNFIPQSIYLNAGLLILALIIYDKVEQTFYKIANKYFFTSLYDVEEVIEETSLKLSSSIDDKEIFDYLIQSLKDNFKATAVSIMKYNPKTKKYIIKANDGFDYNGKKAVKSDKKLRIDYINKNIPVIVEQLMAIEKGKTKTFLKNLKKHGVALIVPLKAENKTVGLITLGEKESQDIYNKEDIKTLNIISYQAATAIQNALLYKETLKFNKRLKTEIKKATAKLERANRKLKRLDEAKNEFISIASHQLKTPLTSIKGFSSLLVNERFGKISKKQKEVIHKISIANQRLINLVDDLLNVSRIEQGRMQYEFELTDVRKIIKNVLNTMKIQANYKGLYLKFIDKAKKEENLLIKADKKKFSEVIGNLVDNSIKYTQKGGIKVILEKAGKKNILIKIKDTGVGIPKEDLDRLFEKFTRGKNISKMKADGTGIGLFVVQKITEAHGGEVWVDSKGEGKGSTFFVKIPLAQK
ncbi:MAG: hypothetical protein GF347_05285 [Candidatus Moranbacteria bacterium]|nr:hypothetical protein [Candidatus Moranbacteria bacterium]